MKRSVLSIALLVMASVFLAFRLTAAPQSAKPAAALSVTDALDYLVQSACVDASGIPVDRLPLDPDCGQRRLLHETDPLHWRKHDWGESNGPVAGWQASDSVLAERSGVSFVDQTFDFGAPATDNSGQADAFYRFDANDGGDAIMMIGDTASIFLTQDGGMPGLQWFIGPGCAQPGIGRYLAWALFRTDVSAEWQSIVRDMHYMPKDDCPPRFNHALTRYRLVSEDFPFQRPGPNGSAIRQTAMLSTVIAEHFDARTLANAHAMERFYYARFWGKVRWEAWSRDDRKSSQAAALARSGRCAPLADSGAPDDGWQMVDCRMWTNIVVVPPQRIWRVRDFNWPPTDLLLRAAG